MLDELISQNEGKTLEFKENASNHMKIIKTIIAFANTAGGIIVIGVRDKSKEIIGVEHVLREEEKLTNFIADLISPMLMPEIDVISHLGKELLLISVPHLAGPYYLRKSKIDRGTYIRLGSSNRVADPETLASLQRLAKRESFDEMACVPAGIEDLDKGLIEKKLKPLFKKIMLRHYESLGLVKLHRKKKCPTYGGILLFGVNKTKWLPDSIIKCVSFASNDRKNIIDKRELGENIIDSVSDAILFVQKNTKIASEIGMIKRIDIPEYPIEAVRESVINAIVHADYSVTGASVQISIYSDRIEIINPGGLPFGQTMNSALSGMSKMRNPIIGRIFRELGIIETLGTGMINILQSYKDIPALPPKFEEIDHFFKVTLYARQFGGVIDEPWASQLEEVFKLNTEVSTSEMAEVWGVTVRTARDRLNKLIDVGYLRRNAKSKNDPKATYSKIQ